MDSIDAKKIFEIFEYLQDDAASYIILTYSSQNNGKLFVKTVNGETMTIEGSK